MDATARIVVGTAEDQRLVARELLTPAPLGARMADGVLHLVGTAAGPLGGDRLHLSLTVLAGTRLIVRSVAASVAQRGNGSLSTHHVAVTVQTGAHLEWDVQPLIAADGCHHRASAEVVLDDGASVVWRDELILGRTGEQPGSCRSGVRIVRGGEPVLHHEISTAVPGWDGPAVTAGAKAVGQVVVVGSSVPASSTDDSRAAWLRLDDDVGLGMALADDHCALRDALARVAAAHDRHFSG